MGEDPAGRSSGGECQIVTFSSHVSTNPKIYKQISPSTGSGQKVMTVVEWSERWKTNKDDPSLSKCLCCKGTNTKEHHFSQTWCRGSVKWESEILCLDCFTFSKREFSDPKFKTPQQHEKEQWEGMAQV